MSNTTYKSKVGYQSPIKLNQTLEWEEGTADKISKYIAGEIDNLILESCMKVVCDVNEEELLKALQYDRGQYEKGYADGKRDAQPHWVSVEEPPKDKQECFVAYKGPLGFVYDTGRFYDDLNSGLDEDIFVEGTSGFVFGGEVGYALESMDYWMPIEPPKEG